MIEIIQITVLLSFFFTNSYEEMKDEKQVHDQKRFTLLQRLLQVN
ncbi:MAG: hypothetical protein ACXAC8_19860 [Candidatus Hodarchaeales archaeon]|jgi:hypothetical protein